MTKEGGIIKLNVERFTGRASAGLLHRAMGLTEEEILSPLPIITQDQFDVEGNYLGESIFGIMKNYQQEFETFPLDSNNKLDINEGARGYYSQPIIRLIKGIPHYLFFRVLAEPMQDEPPLPSPEDIFTNGLRSRGLEVMDGDIKNLYEEMLNNGLDPDDILNLIEYQMDCGWGVHTASSYSASPFHVSSWSCKPNTREGKQLAIMVEVPCSIVTSTKLTNEKDLKDFDFITKMDIQVPDPNNFTMYGESEFVCVNPLIKPEFIKKVVVIEGPYEQTTMTAYSKD